MKYLVFDNMEMCCEAEVQRLLPLASPQRQAEALRFKHTFGQFACLKSYELLLQLLCEEGVIANTDKPTFVVGEHGKPSLAELPQVHFNLSHCKQAVAAAIDVNPVGIDVERFITPSLSLLHYCMSDSEIAQIQQSNHPDQTFASFWTRKEALFKYSGSGITSDIRQLLSHPDPDIHIATTINTTKGYALSIVSK